MMQNIVFSDTLIYAFFAFLFTQIGFSVFSPAGTKRGVKATVLILLSLVIVVAMTVADFASGVSMRDRITGLVVCRISPDLDRCVEISESTSRYTKEAITDLAVERLMGDPYGRTREEVLENIVRIRYSPNGLCGSGRNWIVTVHVPAGAVGNVMPIDGDIMFDDRLGDWSCWGLPYLD